MGEYSGENEGEGVVSVEADGESIENDGAETEVEGVEASSAEGEGVNEGDDDIEEENDMASEEKKYLKQSFIQSEEYNFYIDVLNTLLEEDTLYTKSEVESILDKFLNPEVE